MKDPAPWRTNRKATALALATLAAAFLLAVSTLYAWILSSIDPPSFLPPSLLPFPRDHLSGNSSFSNTTCGSGPGAIMCGGSQPASERAQLPKQVKPVNYKLVLRPNLETFKFTGTVEIDLDVLENTDSIVLHVNEVEITSAKITNTSLKTDNVHAAKDITYDKKKETATLTFPQAFVGGGKAKLLLDFAGTHNDKMVGFYRSTYTDSEGQSKNLVVTQFEATDARRAFPCWDEPALKATFDVTLEVKKHLTALSNMNVVDERVDGDIKIVKFGKTPIMSTYLVAFAVGEFVYIEAYTSGKFNGRPVQCRLYTIKGSEKQGEFALDVKVKTLEYFAEIFDIAYPLPKCDSIAVPDFEAGAMENWGLITFRTTALLFDPSQSSARTKQGIAYTMAHELAHQWFGNYVSPEWWSHLWLNEGFATWVGYLAVDHLFPDWDIFTQFVMDGLQRGLALDALRSSHPIEVEVSDPAEIHQIFDAISYYKGASVIRMLANSLGMGTFLKGVSAYLKRHAYANAATNDLWTALSEASGVDVGEYMEAWTRSIGHPVVTVTLEGKNSIRVCQNRYLSSGDVKPEEDTTIWWIPLSIISGQSDKPTSDILRVKEAIFDLPPGSSESFFKLNAHGTGVYRTAYPTEVIQRMSNAIRNGSGLVTSDRVVILTNVGALCVSGQSRTSSLLTLLEAFENEKEYIVWNEIATRLNTIHSVWFMEPQDICDKLRALQRKLFAPVVRRLGWDYPQDESFLTSLLRTLAISRAGKAHDPEVVREGQRRFGLFVAGDESAIHPNLRGTVFDIAISHGGAKEYEAVLDYYRHTTVPDQKVTALSTLGSTRDASLIQRTLDFALTADVRPQDIIYVWSSLGANHLARDALWTFTKTHWGIFEERYRSSMAMLGIIVKTSTEFSTEKKAAEVDAFFQSKDKKPIERPLQQSLERIRANAKWLARDRGDVAEWLGAHVKA